MQHNAVVSKTSYTIPVEICVLCRNSILLNYVTSQQLVATTEIL